MGKEEKEIKKPVSIELGDLKDLVKLVVSSLHPTERITGYIGYYEVKDGIIFFILNSSLGYYDLNALPIITWVKTLEKPTGSFIRYKTSPTEELSFANDASDPKWLTLPLVKFKEMPEFLRVWE